MKAATPRTETKGKIRPNNISHDLPSPIHSNGFVDMDVKVNLILAQLMSHPQAANDAFRELLALFDDQETVSLLLSSKIEQIILSSIMQYRLCLGKKLAVTTNPRESAERTQVLILFRSVTNILDAIFKNNSLKKMPNKDILKELMPQVISIIIDPKLDGMPEGEQIIRLANVLATNIVVNADATCMLCALISQLHECVAGTSSFGPQGDKFMNLVLKSLWKMTRTIDSFINDLEMDKILLHTHEFLVAFPAPFWKVEGRKDVPLRTIKTIIFLIVKNIGEEILDHVGLIPNPENTDLWRYLHRILNDMRQNNHQVNPFSPDMRQQQVNSSHPLTPETRQKHLTHWFPFLLT